MKALLIDTYRNENDLILWLKTPDENIRLVKKFSQQIYLEANPLAKSILEKHKANYTLKRKLTYFEKTKAVYEVTIHNIKNFEHIVAKIEKEARYRLNLYDADVSPEQMFLFKNNLKPFDLVEVVDDKVYPLKQEVAPPLEKIEIKVIPMSDVRLGSHPINSIILDNSILRGEEPVILKEFVERFISKDPDVVLMEDAFMMLPYLAKRLIINGLRCPFHRWDAREINPKGGKTFFSYGRVVYRTYATRLNGRLLLDMAATVGTECSLDTIIELSHLSGTRLQQIASRSFGAVFQSSLVAELIRNNYLVPFKEKPVDKPISMHTLLKFDRVGHTFDSLTGLHTDVAEIDFWSLFPSIIRNHNISPETMQSGEGPYQEIPGLPMKISLRKKGLIPTAIQPFLDRRMYYKKNLSALNKAKAQGLKWVLVTSYGYLRFREFKLGMASSHMAIGAFARDILLKTKEICEQHGYRIVHGIVDSLYIQKKDINENEVKDLCREIEIEIGIPISLEGVYKWIVFLPSVNDIKRPVPTRYYGVFKNGDLKVRGLELRQSGTPNIVKEFQRRAIEAIGIAGSKHEIQALFPILCQMLRKTLFILPKCNANDLVSFIRISKSEYQNDIPQKIAVDLLRKKGINVVAGQKVYYIFARKGIVLPEDYKGKPDIERYKRLLVRALFVILQPFGFTKEEINEYTSFTRQQTLLEYLRDEIIVKNEPISLDIPTQSI